MVRSARANVPAPIVIKLQGALAKHVLLDTGEKIVKICVQIIAHSVTGLLVALGVELATGNLVVKLIAFVSMMDPVTEILVDVLLGLVTD